MNEFLDDASANVGAVAFLGLALGALLVTTSLPMLVIAIVVYKFVTE